MKKQNQRLKFSWLHVFIGLGFSSCFSLGCFFLSPPLLQRIAEGILAVFCLLYLYGRFMTDVRIHDLVFGGWVLVFTGYSLLIKHISLPNYSFFLLHSLAVLSTFVYYLYWRKRYPSPNGTKDN
jgi:hypothetical protein